MRSLSLPAALALILVPSLAHAQDSDGDGVPNGSDAFPCDASASAVAFAPAEGARAQVLFEDQWPSQGDLDFNDVVVAYHYRFALDAQARVRAIHARFDVRAVGGGFSNGLGLHLPVSRDGVTVTRAVGGGAATPLAISGADAQLTVPLSPNLRELFGNAAFQINSLGDETSVAGDRLEIEIRFAQPVSLSIGAAPFDLFIFRAEDPRHEIHLPAFRGTAAMNTALFGSGDDGTTAERAFVDTRGLPFALVVPELTTYPREATDIAQLFPNILAFAASGGASARDFYATGVSLAAAYLDASGQRGVVLPAIATGADRSCIGTQLPTAGLGLWLRADDLASGAVSRWPDFSGSANDAVQAGAAQRPTVVPNAMNGRAVVRFDGVDDRLDLTGNTFAPTTPHLTVFAVLRTTRTNQHVIGTGSSDPGFLTTFGGGVTVVNGRAVLKANSNGSGLHLSSGDTVADGAARLVAGVISTGSSALFSNGARVGSSASAANAHTYVKSSLGASDGSNLGSSRDAFQGDLAELVVYTRALGTAERIAIERYLGERYGLPLTLEPGCDGVAGSAAVVDDCGVCGGLGASCAADRLPSAGRTLWLRAHDLAGTVGNGTTVDTWRDASSAANDATQTTLARRPVYRAAGLNGRPALELDGVDDRLDLTANTFATASYPLTVCAVFATTRAAAHVVGHGSSSAGFLSTYGGGLVVNNGRAALKANSNGAGLFLTGSAVVNDGQPRVVCGVARTAGVSTLHGGGVADGSSSSGANAYGYTRSTIGASDGSASNTARDPFAGTIAEIVVYGRALETSEREAVEEYLGRKYGVSVVMPAGCDGVQGSHRVLDACGVCGGDGATCGADAVTAAAPSLWLRAQDLGALADGAQVSHWSDAAIGGGHSASQGTPARAPVYRRAAFGGLGGVEFDGVDDRLDLAGNAFAAAGYPQTVFVVLRTTDSAGHVVGTGSSGSGFLASYGGGVTVNGGLATLKANSAGSGLHLSGTGAVNSGAAQLVSGVARGGSSAVYVDCAARGVSSSAVNPYAYTRATIGASDGSATGASMDPLAGQIAEILVFPRALSDSARQGVQGYLASKFGITCANVPLGPEVTLADATSFWRMTESGTAQRDDVYGVLPVASFPVNATGTTPTPAIVGLGQRVNGPAGYHFWRPSAASLDHGRGSFTWAGWVRFDSTYDNQTFVGKWNNVSGAGREYRVWLERSSGRMVFEVSADGLASSVGRVVHPEAIATGTYYFVEAWHDAEGDTINLRIGTQSHRGAVATTPWSRGVFFGGADLNIAAHNTCADAHLDGVIDAVGFWRRTLTAAESQRLWNNGSGWEP